MARALERIRPGSRFTLSSRHGLTSKSPDLLWLNNKFKSALISSEKNEEIHPDVTEYSEFLSNILRLFFCRGRTPEYYSKAIGPFLASSVAKVRDTFQYGSDGPETKV